MTIYKLSKENFEILSHWEYPGTIPADLAWDGQYLWAIDEIDSTLYALDPRDGRTVREVKLDQEIFPSARGGSMGRHRVVGLGYALRHPTD
jgi:hypothetical protein